MKSPRQIKNRAFARAVAKTKRKRYLWRALLAEVEFAVKIFHGSAKDRYLWIGAAAVLGPERFAEIRYQQQSENLSDGEAQFPVRAFQRKLTEVINKNGVINTYEQRIREEREKISYNL